MTTRIPKAKNEGKEGRVTEHNATDSDALSDAPSTGGWRFFLWWMLAFLGFPIGGFLALVLVGSVEGVVSGALGGGLAGAVIGAAQWLVLRRYIGIGLEWVLATALGVAIGDGLGALLTGAGTGLGCPARHRPGHGRRGGAAAVGARPAGPASAREPVAACCGGRLAGWLDGDVGVWHRRRARLLRLRRDRRAGLRRDHRRGTASHAPRPGPLAWNGPPQQTCSKQRGRRGQPQMNDHEGLHVVFGTGPVGLAVMDELVSNGKRVRMVNRSGRASVPHGVEAVGGDATDEAFAREVSEGASSSTSPSTRPCARLSRCSTSSRDRSLWTTPSSNGRSASTPRRSRRR